MLKKHIPNTITCCNLISGCVATYWAFQDNNEMALAFIILGALFDFFDGMSARLLHVSSPIGKELDSLADCITFGFAPSAIVFSFLTTASSAVGPHCMSPLEIPFLATGGFYSLVFIMAAFSALRLAKFNLDERQSMGFIGLPTPANALFWGSLVVGFGQALQQISAFPGLILLGVFLSCWLLVSEVPMFALKFKTFGWQGNQVRYLFIALSALIILLFGPIKCWAVIIPLYVCLSIVLSFKKKI